MCGFWHALCLTFSDENMLAGEEHWRAQPCSAPALRARLLLSSPLHCHLCANTEQLKTLEQLDFPGHIITESSLLPCAQLLISGNVLL